jgi:acyl-CoA thioesterase I
VVLPAMEFSHRAMPQIVGAPCDHLVVIGDSISSGIGPHTPAWPRMMQQMTGMPIKNLSRPGAGTIEALSMTDEITTEDRVVLLEVGGNDMLAGVPPDEFAKALDSLLARITTPVRTIVMFELPVLPQKMAYGHIQRRLAAKYRVWLIPKRFFVDVLGGARATSDGLHLSESGARHMAVLVTQALSPVLKSPDRTTQRAASETAH